MPKTLSPKALSPLALAAVLATAPIAASAEMARYEIDASHTVVAFLVGHVGYSNVLGRFSDVSGYFMYDPETRELGEVSVDVGLASVESDNEARDNHVQSPDFLDVEANPMMTFTANGGEATSDTAGTVAGTLTLRGQENPLSLSVTLNKVAEYPFGHKKQTVGISARGSLMRSEYGMDYGIANGLVGDEVQILIEAEAIRAD
jgi:polyisoprenoid-binding protein YceI